MSVQLEDYGVMLTRDAAKATNVSVQWIAHLIREKKIQAITTSVGYLIPRTEVVRLSAERDKMPRDARGHIIDGRRRRWQPA